MYNVTIQKYFLLKTLTGDELVSDLIVDIAPILLQTELWFKDTLKTFRDRKADKVYIVLKSLSSQMDNRILSSIIRMILNESGVHICEITIGDIEVSPLELDIAKHFGKHPSPRWKRDILTYLMDEGEQDLVKILIASTDWYKTYIEPNQCVLDNKLKADVIETFRSYIELYKGCSTFNKLVQAISTHYTYFAHSVEAQQYLFENLDKYAKQVWFVQYQYNQDPLLFEGLDIETKKFLKLWCNISVI